MTSWREWVQGNLGPGILAGIDLPDWLRLLHENRWAIDARHLPRANAITLNALLNARIRKREEAEYVPQVKSVGVPPPLFILGHWRTGTTHLQNLLALDPQFATPTVYQTSFPHTFLTPQPLRIRMMEACMPPTRPMDQMSQSFDAPNEDEFALCTMTALSPYMSWVFPRRADHYDRYLTFADADASDIERWKEAFRLFVRKLTLKDGRTLILKSPPHTARIRLLLSLFPDARFVHIHRHPFTVFQSTRHTNHALLRLTSLQRTESEDLDERIIRRYTVMHDRYFEDKPLIAADRFHEVRYEDLDRDPLGEIGRLYEKLNLAGFSKAEDELRKYVTGKKSYKKNSFEELSQPLRKHLHREWQRCFDEWRYLERID